MTGPYTNSPTLKRRALEGRLSVAARLVYDGIVRGMALNNSDVNITTMMIILSTFIERILTYAFEYNFFCGAGLVFVCVCFALYEIELLI